MASRIVQYFADKLKSMKDYPITLTKAVYDENGNRLDNKLSEIEDDITGLNSGLSNINNGNINLTTNSFLFSNNLDTNNKQIVGSESTNVYLGNNDVTEVFFQMNNSSYKLTDILNSTRTTNLEFNLSTEFQDTFNILDGHQNSFIFGNLVVIDMMYNYNNKREDEFWDDKFSINVRLKHKITGIITSWNGTGYATMEIYPANDGSNKSFCNVQGIGRLNTGYCQFHAIGIKA